MQALTSVSNTNRLYWFSILHPLHNLWIFPQHMMLRYDFVNSTFFTLLNLVIQIYWMESSSYMPCLYHKKSKSFQAMNRLQHIIYQWAYAKLLSNQWEYIFWAEMINWRFYMTNTHHGQLWAKHQLCLWSCNNVFQFGVWKQYHINMIKYERNRLIRMWQLRWPNKASVTKQR